MRIFSLCLLLFTFCFLVIAQRCRCGQTIRSKRSFVSGPEKYPWMTQIMLLKNDIPTNSCSGTIINSQWIITAAHCFTDDSLTPVVFVGDVNFKNSSDGIKVTQVVTHPNFNSVYSLINDVALIKLDKPLTFNRNIQPICLPSSSDIRRDYGFVISVGWNNMSSILQESTQSQSQNCYKYQEYNEYSQICTKINKNSLCSSTSLFLNEYDIFTLIGIGSNMVGNHTCNTEDEDYYARVSNYINWIGSYTSGQC